MVAVGVLWISAGFRKVGKFHTELSTGFPGNYLLLGLDPGAGDLR